MNDQDIIEKILNKFLEDNSNCCECDAPCNVCLILVVNHATTFINIPLGITLCCSCCSSLAKLKGDYAYSFAYSSLTPSNIPLTAALVLSNLTNSTWNSQAIKEIRKSLNSINLHGMFL